MLSYRHAFHAGNHADVLKHCIVVHLLRYLAQKDKAFWYIDTHAGAGAYALREGYAQKLLEFETGIARLWQRTDLPPPLHDYLEAVGTLNPDGDLRFYPGSPYLAWQTLREQDRMRLFEMHPTEIDVLRDNFRNAGRRVMIVDGDGFTGIKALLPPPTRRALTLIDPSYEDKRDYARTLDCVDECLKRFATGVYAIWYPQVARPEAQRFPAQLKRLRQDRWLHVALSISAAPKDGLGLYGSGMFVINPPYTLATTLRETMPLLVDTLGIDRHARFMLDFN